MTGPRAPDAPNDRGVTWAGETALDHERQDDSAPQVGSRLERRREAQRRSKVSFFAELPVLVLVAFVLALLLKTFLVQAFYIPSESMLPTLAVGDRVLVNKLAHDFREPERGEVVVFSHEDAVPGAEPHNNPVVRTLQSLASGLGFVQSGESDFIKRIIGLPGETIEMREGIVHVDGEPVPEAAQDSGGYLSRPDLVDFGPVEIPEGHYFLMGDNRPNSSDSRSLLGTIHRDDIIGRAFAVVWPLDRLESLSIPEYEGSAEAGQWEPEELPAEDARRDAEPAAALSGAGG